MLREILQAANRLADDVESGRKDWKAVTQFINSVPPEYRNEVSQIFVMPSTTRLEVHNSAE